MKKVLIFLLLTVLTVAAFAQRGGSAQQARSFIPLCTDPLPGVCPMQHYVCWSSSDIINQCTIVGSSSVWSSHATGTISVNGDDCNVVADELGQPTCGTVDGTSEIAGEIPLANIADNFIRNFENDIMDGTLTIDPASSGDLQKLLVYIDDVAGAGADRVGILVSSDDDMDDGSNCRGVPLEVRENRGTTNDLLAEIDCDGKFYSNKGFETADQEAVSPGNLIRILDNDANTFDTDCATAGVAGTFTIIDTDKTSADSWKACNGTADLFSFAAAGYQTIEDNGTPETQRTVLNLIGSAVTCVDNDPSTDCTISSGAAITLDLSDDAADESTDLSEIATTGAAAATIFTEPTADKLLIDTDVDWPNAATATALAANAGNCTSGQVADGVDASGAAECDTISGDITYNNGVVNVSEADALAADPNNCTSGQVADGIQANGTADCDTIGGDITYNNGTVVVVDVACTGECISDAEVADNITASSYLPLSGGTLTGEVVVDNLGFDFVESDSNPGCAAGEYRIYADLSETRLKKCMNGNLTDMDTTGGSPAFSDITGGTNTTAAMIVGSGATLTLATGGNIQSDQVRIEVHNDSGATLFKCTPVYISGFDIPSDLPEVSIADSDGAGTMPAVGLVAADITNGSDGFAVVMGTFDNVDTAVTEVWSVGDVIYVNDSGTSASSDCGNAMTNVRPANTDDGIQSIGRVGRVNATTGQIVIFGAGRSNDVPNLPDATLWVGNGSNVATSVSMSGDATMANTGAVTVVDDLHNHVITNIDAFLESELETQLSNVTNVFTDNDGALADDDLSDDTIAAHAASTSANLIGVLSDEEGTGFAVFSVSPTITTPTFDGNADFNDNLGDSPAATFTPQTNTAWSVFVEESGGDLQLQSNTVNDEIVDIINIDGTGTASLVVEGTITEQGSGVLNTSDNIDQLADVATSCDAEASEICIGNAASFVGKVTPDCDGDGDKFEFDQTANAFVCNTLVAADIPSMGFDTLAGGTNTSAAMIVGSGASLTVSGTGTIEARITDLQDADGTNTLSNSEHQQVWNWTSAAAAASYTALSLSIAHNATSSDGLTQKVVEINRSNDTSAQTLETLLEVENGDADGAVTNGIDILSGAGTMTNAIHLTDANITNVIATDSTSITTTDLAVIDNSVIDDTEMQNESFGDFACDGSEDGCTVTALTLTSDPTDCTATQVADGITTTGAASCDTISGDVSYSDGAVTINANAVDSSMINTIVKSMYWGAGAMSADGTECTTATEGALVTSGPPMWSIACPMTTADTDGFVYGNTVLPDSYSNSVTPTFEITIELSTDGGAGTIHGAIGIQCFTDQETLDTNYTEVQLDIAEVAGDVTDDILQASSSSSLTGESCAGGDLLIWRYRVCDDDATPTTNCSDNNGFENDFNIVGMKMEYTSDVGD